MWFIFICIVLLCACLYWFVTAQESTDPPVHSTHSKNLLKSFKSFQREYLLTYFCFLFTDWLSGPSLYALYEDYGFKMSSIAIFYMLDSFSSMLLGSFVGGWVDIFGRKWFSVVCGVLLCMASFGKFSPSASVLAIGAVLGGLGNSLLMISFESWMSSEHSKRKFPAAWLSETFSNQIVGSGILAILAGLTVSIVEEYGSTSIFHSKYATVFTLSLVMAAIGSIVIGIRWPENYGAMSTSFSSLYVLAFTHLKNSPHALSLGLTQAFFEGALFSFVFIWTPALESYTTSLGLIFATFMVCVMCGSFLFRLLRANNWSSTNILFLSFVGSLFAMGIASIFVGRHFGLLLTAFFIFEVCCGIYYPAIGVLRSVYIPDNVHGAVLGIFQLPLNLIVVLVLTSADKFSVGSLLLIISLLVFIALLSHLIFSRSLKTKEIS